MAYIVGDDIKTRITFDVDNTPTDPTAWSLLFRQRGASTFTTLVFGVDSELAAISTGVFEWTHATDGATNDDAGRWEYHVRSTGVAKGAKPGFFNVDRSAMFE